MNIESIQNICKELPSVEEDIKWDNDLCFTIGKKMFCVVCLTPPLKVSFKVKYEEFEELSHSAGIIPAPYLARYKWIQVGDPDRFSKKEWEKFIAQSYELIKSKLPRKILKELGE